MRGAIRELKEALKAHVTVVKNNRNHNGYISLPEVVVTVVILLMIAGAMIFTANIMQKARSDAKLGVSPPERSTPKPETVSAPVDASLGINIAIITGVVIILAVVAFFAFKVFSNARVDYRSRVEAEKTQKIADMVHRKHLERRRDNAIISVTESELAQARWMMDPAILIDYPEFTNYSAAPVSALTKAYKEAVRLRDDFNHLGDKFTEQQLESLEISATNLSVKLHAAQEYAKNLGWGKTSFAEKRLFKRAKSQISIAANEAVNEHERAAALRGLQGVLDQLREAHGRVINVSKLTQAIEAKARPKELTAGANTMSGTAFAV